MITIPALPTDSLYKFLFVGGIVLTVFCLYQRIPLKAELDKAEIKSDSISAVLKGIEKSTSAIDKRRLTLNKIVDKVSNNIIVLSISSEKKLLDSSRKLTEELHNIYADSQLLNKPQKDLKDHFDNLKIEFYFVCYLIILGSLMIGFGGTMWYWKVQFYQDKILILQY